MNNGGIGACLYSTVMSLFQLVVKAGGSRILRWATKDGGKKQQFVMGQKGLLPHIRQEMAGEEHRVCWIHCASMGEYAVARPLIKGLREQGWSVVLTFFSPSGYEPLRQRENVADHLFYLPIDSRRNARRFLDAVKPKKAVFIISEYWVNLLSALGKRHIPTFFVSMLVPDSHYLPKWYARPIRRALKAVTTFMVINEETRKNMGQMGFHNCRLTGDPLFDNALQIAGSDYRNPIVEHFCQTADEVFVGGSINDINDVNIISGFANRQPKLKFIIAPHEISQESLRNLQNRLEGKSVLYSECTAESDFATVQTLIIDYVGDLARLYRYGKCAYIGGGFTPYLHSVIEPVAYGLPITFGPNIHRKATPRQMMDRGFAAIVTTDEELEQWYIGIRNTDYEKAHTAALDYARSNGGATETILNIITEQ